MTPKLIIEKLAGSFEQSSGRLRSGSEARERGDYDLNPGYRPTGALTPAAVLVPLITHTGGMTVLLTQRTDHLHDHAGQVSFPGGYHQSGDGSLETTALRETEEELGIPRSEVEVLGVFQDYLSITKALVRPYIAVLKKDPQLTLNPGEVDFAFQVPMQHFLENEPVVRRQERLGKMADIYYWDYQGKTIWGLTAAIIKDFLDALK